VPPFCKVEYGRLREQDDPWVMLDSAAKAIGRRDKEWTEAHVDFYFKLHAQTELERAEAIRECDQRNLCRAV
jgi:hypothetical protein